MLNQKVYILPYTYYNLEVESMTKRDIKTVLMRDLEGNMKYTIKVIELDSSFFSDTVFIKGIVKARTNINDLEIGSEITTIVNKNLIDVLDGEEIL